MFFKLKIHVLRILTLQNQGYQCDNTYRLAFFFALFIDFLAYLFAIYVSFFHLLSIPSPIKSTKKECYKTLHDDKKERRPP